MSLEKAIRFGKEKRKPFRGSAAWAGSCRHGGSCGYCQNNRMHATNKGETSADLDVQVDEWFGYWNMPDGSDVIQDLYDKRLEEIGVDPWDFQTRIELDV